MALGDIYLDFTWQAWHTLTSTVVLRGRRGTYGIGTDGTGWRHFAWQARHKVTSTVVLRGRRGTKSHLPSFCVAGVVQMALGGALGLGLGARDAAAFCVAGAAQSHIYRRFAWQAWHKVTSTVVLRGRRGTNSHLPSFCVAGVVQMALGGALGLGLGARDAAAFCVAGAAQSHIYRRFAWQARHTLTSTVVLRGRRGTYGICTDGTGWRHFAWQARHKVTSTVVLRGRRGTKSHLPSFCVAGVVQMALGGALGLGLGARDAAAFCVAGAAQSHIYRRFAWHFAWQAWHKVTSTVVLRGRRGTDGTGWRAWSWFRRPWSAAFCAICTTPATQNDGRCEFVPRLPRKMPRRHGRLNQDQARHPVPSVPRLPRKTTVDVTLCHACHAKRR